MIKAWTDLRALGLLRRIARALESIEAEVTKGKRPKGTPRVAVMSRPTADDWNDRWLKRQAEK